MSERSKRDEKAPDSQSAKFSRREREIMDALYKLNVRHVGLAVKPAS